MNRDTTFADFTDANNERRPCFNNKLGDWTPNDWMTALCGEVGELANMLKKLRRGQVIRGKALPTKADLAREIADIYTYLDLLAQELGIDTGDAITSGFHAVSREVGDPKEPHAKRGEYPIVPAPIVTPDPRNQCKKCGYSGPFETRNFDAVAREADFHCGKCGEFVRSWNP